MIKSVTLISKSAIVLSEVMIIHDLLEEDIDLDELGAREFAETIHSVINCVEDEIRVDLEELQKLNDPDANWKWFGDYGVKHWQSLAASLTRLAEVINSACAFEALRRPENVS